MYFLDYKKKFGVAFLRTKNKIYFLKLEQKIFNNKCKKKKNLW